MIQQGGLKANEARITPDDPTLATSALLYGHVLLLQKGKRIETLTYVDLTSDRDPA